MQLFFGWVLGFVFCFSGQQQGTSLFGQTPSPFGQPQQTPAFGQTQASFGQTPQTSAFGQAGQSPLFGGQQQQQPSLFNQASGGLFGQQQSNPFQSQPAQQTNMFSGSLTTQMAPVAPVVVPLPDREIQVKDSVMSSFRGLRALSVDYFVL